MACVASILEKNIEDIPDLYSFSGLDWWDQLYAYCIENDLGLLILSEGVANYSLMVNCFGIGCATVKGSEERHAVILKYKLISKGQKWTWEGELVHDPNPLKPELIKFEEHIFIFRKGEFIL